MIQSRLVAIPPVLLGLCVLACGSSDDGTGTEPDIMGSGGAGVGGAGVGGMDGITDPPPAGAIEWPAGHADQCDPLPDTGYSNDEHCLKPPDPEVGYQLHFGPEDYDNPDDVNQFVLAPGGEDLTCVYDTTGNDVARHIAYEHTRLRAGTHHMIVWASPNGTDPNAPPDGTYAPQGCSNFVGLFHTGAQAGLGTDGGILDLPLPNDNGQVENPGYARYVQAYTSVNIDLHYVNATGEPILKEAWINEVYADEATVTKTLDPIFFLGGLGMAVQPGVTEIVGVDQCTLPQTPEGSGGVEVMGISGHAHAHTTRVSAWVNRGDGSRELVYETFDWSDPINAEFDSTHTYPPPDGTGDGAHTGPLALAPGDTFGWECEVANNDLNTPLNFANEAYTGEMCNIFGFFVPGNGSMWPCGLNSGVAFNHDTTTRKPAYQ